MLPRSQTPRREGCARLAAFLVLLARPDAHDVIAGAFDDGRRVAELSHFGI